LRCSGFLYAGRGSDDCQNEQPKSHVVFTTLFAKEHHLLNFGARRACIAGFSHIWTPIMACCRDATMVRRVTDRECLDAALKRIGLVNRRLQPLSQLSIVNDRTAQRVHLIAAVD
jgi:hypothetical protein